MKKGFYHPTAVIILAVITLSFALIFYINSKYLLKPPQPTPPAQVSPIPSPSPKQSPKDDLSTEASAKDETANWKTYKSDQIMFSIKYPSEVKIDEIPGGVVFYIGNKLTLPAGSIIDPYPKSLAILARGKDLSEAQVVGGSDLKITTVAGLPAYYVNRANSSTVYYWIYTDDKSNVVRIDIRPKEDQESYSMFDQILSTFQFLN
ncbi:MAG: hypothetical protein AAB512_03985 [Patescibacteria group bacterium]